MALKLNKGIENGQMYVIFSLLGVKTGERARKM
jgi:hypothetical protein